ncbi:MAG: DJ-1/PfpI family protein [Lachnospiraceae bacterium]|jgi:4-methyl-5(b-hydroxyethyl)-thiazole monophosphate biosynthesis|nr:DJ-1/PfpI family protein [Lachnospiraceae bacterium]
MKILLLCLNAFETMEFSPFVDVIGWAHDDFNCDILIDICGFNRNIVSTFGVSITADILIDDVDVDQYDALAIPGGFEEYGFYKEAYHEKTLNLIRSFHSHHKPIASVCVAAFPLAKSGILKNRKATTYHLRGGYKREELKNFGAVLGDEWIVVDDNIITSSCPKTAPDVAFHLLEMLTSKEKTIEVKKAMGY